MPEERIYSLNYLSQRPHMKHLYGGTVVCQGVKQHPLAAEISDYRIFMTDEAFANDLHKIELINGYQSEVLEPMKRHRVSYRNDKLDSGFDVELTAIMPAACWKEVGHFEQAMKTKGEVVLRGKRYAVNGYHIRDRTWAEIRNEDPVDIPPVTWMGCTFDDDFAFNCFAMDHPDMDPIWKGKIAAPEKLLLGGWVWRDGELTPITSCRKITRYDEQLTPKSFAFLMKDAKGRDYEVKGTIVAGVQWRAWWNIDTRMCLAEIECNGRKGHCDFQDIRWANFFRACGR